MNPHQQLKKKSKKLLTSITVGFSVILILMIFSFVGWVGISFKYRINQVKDNLISNWNYIYDVIEPSVFNGNKDASRTGPLIPIKYKRLPSPFSSSRINYYKNSYLHERHSYGNNKAGKAEILVGYSPVELSSGKYGSNFLSAYIWFEDNNLILDKLSTSTGRDSGDHFWFIYHDRDNKTGSILLSLQDVGLFSSAATNGRVAEVSGFIASEFGNPHNLKRENTVKGSLFRDSSTNKYVLVFRIMANNIRAKSRSSIDLTKPIGFRYINRNSIDGTPKILSTFKYVENKLVPIIHTPDTTTVERLADVNKNISSIKLINVKDENKTYKTLLKRTYNINKHVNETYTYPLQQFLIEVTNLLFEENFLRKENELFYDGPNEIELSQGSDTTLRISSNINQQIPSFINEVIPAAYLFLIILVSIIFFYIYIVKHIVQRLVTLASSLEQYKMTPNGKFHDMSLASKDEIGFLAETLKTLLSDIYDKNIIIDDNHKQAVERYDRHNEMTKIYGHDIRTPIAALLSLLEGKKEPLKYIHQIQRASETIMEAAEFEESLTTRLTLKPLELVKFGKAITDGAANFQLNINSIKFNTLSSEIMVIADEEFLEESIDCIINNACDFGNNIIITTRSNTMHGIIEIFDDGVQIDENKIDVIFEYGTSFRENASDSHHGIGLFSAKLRITAMGGTISAFNIEKGVTFIVKLPLVQPQEKTN